MPTALIAATRPVLCQLPHHHHHPLAPERRGRARLQRMRPLHEASWGKKVPFGLGAMFPLACAPCPLTPGCPVPQALVSAGRRFVPVAALGTACGWHLASQSQGKVSVDSNSLGLWS